MTTGDETTQNVGALGHSEGEPDQIKREGGGSDVGGPAAATESTTEEAMSGTSTAGVEDDAHSQETDPS